MATLFEVPQKPYTNGRGVERDAGLSFDFGSDGFRVAKVLSGDLSEIMRPNEPVSRLRDSWPAKTSFHLEFYDLAYDRPFRDQKRVRKGCKIGRKGYPTRGTLAIFVAEEIQKALSHPYFVSFPYHLDQLVVTSVDVRSKGTIQPRVFVAQDISQQLEQADIDLDLEWLLGQKFPREYHDVELALQVPWPTYVTTVA